MEYHRSARGACVAGVIDVAVLAIFAVVGRISHDRELTVLGHLSTLWPFLVGLVAGWLGFRAWRGPRSVVRGVGIWVTTVIVAMFLRTLVGQGAAMTFIVVATIATGLGLVGWRVLAAYLVRSRVASRSQH